MQKIFKTIYDIFLVTTTYKDIYLKLVKFNQFNDIKNDIKLIVK